MTIVSPPTDSMPRMLQEQADRYNELLAQAGRITDQLNKLDMAIQKAAQDRSTTIKDASLLHQMIVLVCDAHGWTRPLLGPPSEMTAAKPPWPVPSMDAGVLTDTCRTCGMPIELLLPEDRGGACGWHHIRTELQTCGPDPTGPVAEPSRIVPSFEHTSEP